MPAEPDTIAALSTPAGTAALAVVRICGPNTAALSAALAGGAPPPRRALRRDYHDREGRLIDDVLMTYFPAPRSYSGEDTLEISCHGSPYIVQTLLEDLHARGCRPALPGEFTQRAFLNGRIDLSQAEAVMDLIQARGERALHAAHQQLRGALSERMEGLIDRLLSLLAQIEAYIDFPDEDLPEEDKASVINHLSDLLADTSHLAATSRFGEMLRDGVKTVIAGEPNAGKSSLLNRLLGRERALVSPEPGTTRDFLEERIIVGAHCLRLIDTAGLNPAPAPLEELGMMRTRERLAEADLILVVIDGRRPEELWTDEIRILSRDPRSIIVLNKSDLSEFVDWDGATSSPTLAVSALTGAGMEALFQAVVARVDAYSLEIGADAVAVSARHAFALAAARAELECARANLQHGAAAELTASHLRGALSAFGEITGKVDNERMLDQLFAAFCIGK